MLWSPPTTNGASAWPRVRAPPDARAHGVIADYGRLAVMHLAGKARFAETRLDPALACTPGLSTRRAADHVRPAGSGAGIALRGRDPFCGIRGSGPTLPKRAAAGQESHHTFNPELDLVLWCHRPLARDQPCPGPLFLTRPEEIQFPAGPNRGPETRWVPGPSVCPYLPTRSVWGKRRATCRSAPGRLRR